MNKRLLLLPFLAAVNSLAFAGGTITWPTPVPAPDANPALTVQSPITPWLNSFEENLQNSRKLAKVDLIFDGDQWAITSGNYGPTGGMWDRFGKAGNAFDFGNRSDTTQSMLWRLQNGQLDGLDPKLVILEIGGNNINSTNTAEQIAEGIKADVAEYQKRCPHAVIVLQSVWPRLGKPGDTIRTKIKAVDQIISSYGDGKKVIYLDFGDKFLQPDGTLSPTALIYSTYPTGEGYKIWADALQPIITQYVPAAAAASTAAPTTTTGTTQPATASTGPVIGGGTVTWPSAPVPPGGNPAVIPEPPLGWLDQFQKKIDESRKMPSVDLLFDGDSITAGWKGGGGGVWGHHYVKLNAYDFGNPGDTTGGLIWQVGTGGQVDGLHPKLIVLLIGTNNLGHATPEQLAAGIKEVINQYQKHIPGAPILLQGIFPRGEKPTDPLREKIKAVNKLISQFADGKTILFLDFGDKFLQPDGSISKDIMPDFLHPSAKGYQIWADAIQPIIDQYFPPAAPPATPPKA